MGVIICDGPFVLGLEEVFRTMGGRYEVSAILGTAAYAAALRGDVVEKAHA